MLSVSSARFLFPELILRAGDSQRISYTAHYINSHWQENDIIYHVGDGSWIDMINYTDHPEAMYKMPLCGVVRGSLSDTTRQGLGIQVEYLEDLSWQRAWVLNASTPMTPDCEQGMITPWISEDDLVYCIHDDNIVNLCLYLITHEQ